MSYSTIGRNISTGLKNTESFKQVDYLNQRSEDVRGTDHSKSLQYAKNAARIAKKINYVSGLAEALRSIASTKSRLSEYKNAVSYLNKSHKLYQSINDLSGIAKVYNGYGILNRKKGNYLKAVENYKNSLQIHKSLRDRKGEAMALNNLGYAYTNLGDYLSALNYHFDAYKIFHEIKYRIGESSSLTNLALIYKELGDFEEDLKHETKSLEIKKEINDVRGISNSLVNLGNTYTTLKNYEEAIKHYEEALQIKKEINDKSGTQYAMIGLANAYAESGRLKEADNLLKICIKEARLTKSKSDEVIVLVAMSNVNLYSGKPKAALEIQKKALKISQDAGFNEFVYRIHEHLSKSYKTIKDYKKSLYHLEEFLNLKNEILNEKSVGKIKNLQILHQVETADKEVQRQKLKNVELATALTELSAALDISDIISRSELDGTIKYVNQNLTDISGFSSEELIGKNYRILNSGYHSKAFYNELWSTIKSGVVWKGEIKNKKKDGAFFWVHTTIVPIFDDKRNPVEFLAISYDITERKNAEEQLVKQFNELETANEELDKFVYSVSHDLRSPLTSILGVLNIADEEITDEDVLRYLGLIRTSINKLDNTVRDIIDYSRNSRMKFVYRNIKLDNIINKCLEGLMHFENFKKVKIITDFINTDTIRSDEYRLTLILKNLLANSIKFSRKNSRNSYVKISLEKTDTEYILNITDNGIGIENDKLVKIFDQFYKANENFYGTGLGLYITKLAVKKLNGKISVTSKLNKGSTFTVTLPIKD